MVATALHALWNNDRVQSLRDAQRGDTDGCGQRARPCIFLEFALQPLGTFCPAQEYFRSLSAGSVSNMPRVSLRRKKASIPRHPVLSFRCGDCLSLSCVTLWLALGKASVPRQPLLSCQGGDCPSLSCATLQKGSRSDTMQQATRRYHRPRTKGKRSKLKSGLKRQPSRTECVPDLQKEPPGKQHC